MELIEIFTSRVNESGAQLHIAPDLEEAYRLAEELVLSNSGDGERIITEQEYTIAEGIYGVAENGGIWLDSTSVSSRVRPFIAENLALIISKSKICSNMEELYRVVSPASTGFGVLISGPSKTADIEQCLVYGAHGAINHYVILY